ncbi:photosystem I reaction center subunit IX [Hydrocarboniphaga sp.]|jgi:photosystem II stability/assembly factor-like uncharacterized protein|uniref:WD40/YVTN/BNR-like repeat-containing protein n=1 Tax=Hydrocarboniphaga sp. TaxID=2033016 RepID=UPI002ABC6478|nr:photosystem I reaction center subunit IX [Hydrocarboniphaga sp.]MDZ4078440.1 photosystem I reaction center subunit IX [Hydrocarboniphaga sp.]
MNLKFRPVVVLGLFLAGAAWATIDKPGINSDSGNTVLTQATPHDRLFSLAFSGSSGLAVGENGLVMSTTDGGKQWTRDKAPTDLAMIDVATNGKRTIAVGQMGLILVRESDGAWRKVESGSTQRLLQVDVNAQGLAFATGAFGTLLKSTDGGDTWTSSAPDWSELYESGEGDSAVLRDEPTNWVVRVADDGSVIIGGEYGQLIRSTDGGATWKVVYRHVAEDGRTAPTLFSLAFRKDGTGYAVGQSGLIVRSTDNGMTWSDLPAPTTSNLFGVDSFADGQVVVVGQRVGMRSRNQGQSWEPIGGLDLNLNWYSALGHSEQAASGEVIGVGHSGRVIRLVP